jgi:hypothetical protein
VSVHPSVIRTLVGVAVTATAFVVRAVTSRRVALGVKRAGAADPSSFAKRVAVKSDLPATP